MDKSGKDFFQQSFKSAIVKKIINVNVHVEQTAGQEPR